MKVELLAFDSMGARSMCTYIETDDVKITVDPGVALGPKRFGFPPHEIELERQKRLAEKIASRATKSDAIVITHYHYDHHDLGDTIPLDIYNGKDVFIKDPVKNLNRSQEDFRAPLFLGILKEKARKVEAADGKSFTFGKTKIEFSGAVFHGTSDAMGYVIETLVDSGDSKIVHTSDVQGPVHGDQTEFILRCKPDLAIVDGPMTYMLGHGYTQENLEASLHNLRKVLDGGLKKLVLDHHFLRDLNYRDYISKICIDYPEAEIMTAAEYMGITNDLLEARRKELYKKI